MGMESMPKNESADMEDDKDKPKKWLEFVDEKGMKTQVAVFEGETDADAMARAKAIDARVAKENQ